MANANRTLTALPGIRVGHWTHAAAGTGCTVVLFDRAVPAAVDVRGSAPGTRETDALHPGGLVGQADAILLTGGSAYGLAAADGVMRYLEARGRGFATSAGPVPIVPGAVIYDLSVGDPSVRPDAAAGEAAADAASTNPVSQGNVGAGTGATIGFGDGCLKGGLGSALLRDVDVLAGALAVVNPAGAVHDPNTGRQLAAASSTTRSGFGQNTTIGVVAVNAALERWQLRKIAEMSHDGLARAVRPAHGMSDGDTIFAVSVGARAENVDLTTVGHAAAEAFSAAVVQGALRARPAYGLPAAQA
ncbi:MAG: P1 family peptidase [Chloroflexota bacterium]|nr:P1 family peptidase [Chloroflexota bacterium]MDE2918520.1 P1 family peptidase [Chloroflexota bacterium]